uniref:ZP domain-containing protein n=1 Tax=Heterorhabditis bacteriophora TaxID=37862 RepID=A0A1I7WWU8_HETBA
MVTVLSRCPYKPNVAIYKSKVPLRVEFTLRDILGEYRSQMSGNYYVKCVVAECTRKEGTILSPCPDYDHCDRMEEWNPDIFFVGMGSTPAHFRLRLYQHYRRAHRH